MLKMLVPACVFAMLAMSAVANTQARDSEGTERFTFAVTNAPKTGLPGEERLEVTIDRWSNDAERDHLATMLDDKDSANRRYAFRSTDAVGYMRWPGGLGYTLRYARRTPRPDGGADLTLVADSRVWVWWDEKINLPLDEPFTVFHVTLDKNGVGQGKVVPASKVRSDKTAGVTADYDSHLSLIVDFTPQRG